jgi:hypothetical protein
VAKNIFIRSAIQPFAPPPKADKPRISPTGHLPTEQTSFVPIETNDRNSESVHGIRQGRHGSDRVSGTNGVRVTRGGDVADYAGIWIYPDPGFIALRRKS